MNFDQLISESVNIAIKEVIQANLQAARNRVDTNPTPAQIKAENYRKGKVRINGFLITIENPKGSYRKGQDRNGKQWKTFMHHDYGYFNCTVGKDGDAVDVFIGPKLESTKIFAVDQKIGGKFDETKVMMCFDNAEEAKSAYLSNYDSNWKGFWKITETDLDTFKSWLYNGRRQRKPFYDYKVFKEYKKKHKLNESYDDIFDYYTDLLDQYANQVHSGQPLSDEQIQQTEEIRDYLVDHDANDNFYMPSWIELADDLANGRTLR